MALAGIRDFFSRNKKAIVGTTVVVSCAGMYAAYNKLSPLITSLKAMYAEMQEFSKQQESTTQIKAQQRFSEGLECHRSILCERALKIQTKLLSVLNVEELRKRLGKPVDPKAFAEFLSAGMTRTLCAVYALSLVDILIKVQLTIYSRSLNESSKPQSFLPLESEGAPLLPELDRKIALHYFAVAEHILTQGVENMAEDIRGIITALFGAWDLKRTCSTAELEGELKTLRHRFEPQDSGDKKGDKKKSSYVDYLFPPEAEVEEGVRLLAETERKSLISQIELAEERDKEWIADQRMMASPVDAEQGQQQEQQRGQGQEVKVDEKLEEAIQQRELASQTRRIKMLATYEQSMKRLRGMLAETRSIVTCESFNLVAKQTVDTAFEHLHQLLTEKEREGGQQAAPRSAAVNMNMLTNAFTPLFPISQERCSAFLEEISESKSVKEICAIIYFPMAMENVMQTVDLEKRQVSYDELHGPKEEQMPMFPFGPALGLGGSFSGFPDFPQLDFQGRQQFPFHALPHAPVVEGDTEQKTREE